jgi:hypothetical protein
MYCKDRTGERLAVDDCFLLGPFAQRFFSSRAGPASPLEDAPLGRAAARASRLRPPRSPRGRAPGVARQGRRPPPHSSPKSARRRLAGLESCSRLVASWPSDRGALSRSPRGRVGRRPPPRRRSGACFVGSAASVGAAGAALPEGRLPVLALSPGRLWGLRRRRPIRPPLASADPRPDPPPTLLAPPAPAAEPLPIAGEEW